MLLLLLEILKNEWNYRKIWFYSSKMTDIAAAAYAVIFFPNFIRFSRSPVVTKTCLVYDKLKLFARSKRTFCKKTFEVPSTKKRVKNETCKLSRSREKISLLKRSSIVFSYIPPDWRKMERLKSVDCITLLCYHEEFCDHWWSKQEVVRLKNKSSPQRGL